MKKTGSTEESKPDTSLNEHTQSKGEPTKSVRSLKELIDRVSGRDFKPSNIGEDAGFADVLPFPFLALVGQREMKLALMLALINPSMGGVLLIGPRGTGKTTAVRSLVDLLPMTPRSLCHYGCMPEDIENGGVDAVCPDCAKKYAEGQQIAALDRIRLVELPLNAKLEDVVGGVDERAATKERKRLKRGLLAQADRNLLYVDEVNLLVDEVVDALLDASSQGSFTVHRGPLSATYRSRFVLIGSMNPEEGQLRPQIQDRFGLRVVIRGLEDDKDRLEAYRRVHSYLANPHKTVAQYKTETGIIKNEIQAAREMLTDVELSDEAASLGLSLIDKLGIDSLRAELTLFEAARAHVAADGRLKVKPADIYEVAPMALRLRRSSFIEKFFSLQQTEEVEIKAVLDEILSPSMSSDE